MTSIEHRWAEGGQQGPTAEEGDARTLSEAVKAAAWAVTTVEEKPTVRRPVPPFTTSTLQQESNRKLRLSARETMRCAQGSTSVASSPTCAPIRCISPTRPSVRSQLRESRYGKEYLSKAPRQFSTKARNAQEAHEAIRPAGELPCPQETGLWRDLALYERSGNARLPARWLKLDSPCCRWISVAEAVFRASSKRIDFPGFFRAYVEGSDDPDAALEGQEVLRRP